MQKCRSQGTASEKQNCWAPPQPSESQDPKAEGGVSSESEYEGWKCVPLLWLADTSLGAALHTCLCKHLSGNSLESGLPDLSCFIPTPSQRGQRGAGANASVTHIN